MTKSPVPDSRPRPDLGRGLSPPIRRRYSKYAVDDWRTVLDGIATPSSSSSSSSSAAATAAAAVVPPVLRRSVSTVLLSSSWRLVTLWRRRAAQSCTNRAFLFPKFHSIIIWCSGCVEGKLFGSNFLSR